MYMRLVVRCLAALAAFATAFAAVPGEAAATGATVTVTNGGAPGWIRFDTGGNGLDAHDGEIKQFFGKYYLYGTSYGCGYVRGHTDADGNPTEFCGFVVYESTDLRHWKYDGKLFDPKGTAPTDWQKTCNSATSSCYRPHVLYDFSSKRYVLWVNTYDTAPDGTQHGYHVLTSTSPTGGFTERTDSAGAAVLPTLAYPTGGDFDLYQDTDGKGYIVYTVRADPLGKNYRYHLVVERLAAGYLTGGGVYTGLATKWTEAPSMFRRGADYYITMADPYCAYCAGTGTAYLRATSPLGPWRGVGGNVSPSYHTMYIDAVGGLFQGTSTDPTVQSQFAGLSDYDISFQAKPLPDTNPTFAHHYGRIGWMFRAKDYRNGYYWVLSSKPYSVTTKVVNKKTHKTTTRTKTYPAKLFKEVIKDGRVVKMTTVGVTVPISTTAMNTVRTRVLGNQIYTYIGNTRIDLTVDNTWPTGYVGFRQRSYYSAYYDNVYWSRPYFMGYQLYLWANFDDGSLASFPTLNRFRRHGVQISSSSCGGQPTDVAQLRATNTTGAAFLYQSDRWDNGDQNEAQATQYWEPLTFNSDGSIKALLCGSTYHTVLADATASSTAMNATQYGSDGFVVAQDITAGHSRGQTFQVSKDGNLDSIKMTLFQGADANGNGPSADLVVSVYDVDNSGGLIAPAVGSATIARSSLSWAPRTVWVPMGVPLTAAPGGGPHTYALVLSTASGSGIYGVARSDGVYDTYLAGAGLNQVSGDATTPGWAAEPRNDLRFALYGTVS
jgi:hypothetical protein